jgi:hydantoinase/carbamoylase family amidase
MRPVTDGKWVNAHLDELARIGALPISGDGWTGVERLVFTPEDMQAREYVKEVMARAGLEVRVDAIGNIIGRLEGRAPGAPAVMTGSHIDTTRYAGQYDGTVGVLGGIEALRAIGALPPDARPKHSIEVVVFTSEEPARFGMGLLGSKAMTGALSRDDLDRLVDQNGVTLAEAMRQVGLDPEQLRDARLASGQLKAFVELHIEQGAVLESRGVPVGLVTVIAAPTDFRATLTGRSGHSGSTPMSLRRDAGAAAAEVVLAVERAALESPSPNTVGTVGVVAIGPGAINVVPGTAILDVDIRDSDGRAKDAAVERVQADIEAICRRRNIEHRIETLTRLEPISADQAIQDVIGRRCRDSGVDFLPMVSGAFHDAMAIAEVAPMGMIFVPSRAGVSHHPEEYTSPDEIALGTQLLADVLYDLAS